MYISKFVYVHTENEKNNIILNGLTGAIDIVTSEIATILKNKNIQQLKKMDPVIFDNLYQRGYIYNNSAEEQKKIDEVYSIYVNNAKECDGYVFAICPTYECNLKCSYCFEDQLTSCKETMSFDMLTKAFNYIKEINKKSRYKNNRINLYGGEPLLLKNKDIVEKIFQFSISEKIDTIIITNGVDINYYIDLLMQYKDCIKEIQITVDGPKEIHDKRRMKKSGEGSFDIISNNVKLLLDKGFFVNVRVNIDQKNLGHIKNLIHFFEEEELVFYSNFASYFNPVYSRHDILEYQVTEDKIVESLLPIFNQDNNISNIYTLLGIKILGHVSSILEKNFTFTVSPMFDYCEAARGEYISFGPDGKCYPCGQAIGVEELCIATFYPDLKINHTQMNNWKNRNVLYLDKCSNCDLSLFCGGGCPYLSWKKTGNLNSPIDCQKNRRVLSNYLTNYKKRNRL